MATDPADPPTQRRTRPWRRWALLTGAALVAATGAGLAWLLLADLAPLATRIARAKLGRDVTIGSASLTGGRTLGLVLTDIQLANPSWARDPDFLRAGRVALRLDLRRLLAGEILLPEAAIDDLQVTLEHGPQGQGNWKPQTPDAAPPDPGRPWLPTILSLDLRRGRLLVHTTGGNELTIATDAASLRTSAPDAPVTLDAPLAYNGAPIALQATMDSFDAYRQRGRRFAFRAAAIATAEGGRIDLDGSAEQPLAFDGVTGRLHADLAHVGRVAAIFGAALPSALAADIAGAFTHQDRLWQLDQVTGQLAGSDLTGRVTLTEGPHGQPDSLDTDLAVARLDLATVLDPSGPPDATPTRLAVSDNPGTRLDARLAVADLRWAARGVTDFRVHATIQPRRIGLDDITLTTEGGQFTGSLLATAANPADPPLLALRAELSHADAAGLLRLAGLRSRVLSGPVDGRASFDARAATLPQLQAAATGQIVLAMRSGRISRDLMALAATDLGLLLTDDGGTTNLACLLAVLDLREGFGVLSPVRLRSGEGTISGGGVLDLARRSLDLSFRTDRDTTSLLALDVPVRISGPFTAPAIRPALTSDAAAIASQGAVAAARLPSPLRSLATDSRCLR